MACCVNILFNGLKLEPGGRLSNTHWRVGNGKLTNNIREDGNLLQKVAYQMTQLNSRFSRLDTGRCRPLVSS